VDPRAWALRTAVIGHCKEALDSIVGLDGADAWALRAAGADLWPSTVVSSLGTLAATAAGHALLAAQLAGHPANLALWRAAWAISPA
jgi:dTMP kinase